MTTRRHYYTPLKLAKHKAKIQMVTQPKAVEKLDHSYTAFGNVKMV